MTLARHTLSNTITCSPRHVVSLLAICLLLTGCQHRLKPPKVPPITTSPHQPVSQIQHPTSFSITGKIGVRTPQQNGSAFYAWTQINDRFAIDLTGALGIGQTHIEGVAGNVSLQSAKTGFIQASSPEELLAQATGWQAPISYLIYWLDAQPAEPTALTEYDAQQRLSALQEGGWSVKFDYQDAQTLPKKLTMNQQLVEGSNRVILTIQSRTEARQ